MDVNQFQAELKTNLSQLEFVEQIITEQNSATYIKIKVTLKPKGFLNIWYNSIRRTQSFSLIIENNRKWGLDFDNRIGQHEHPINNQDSHISIKSHTLIEIVEKLQEVWDLLG